ncbi:MAG TPA: hypothetical protein VKF41_10910 [Bryobacteraceae bacterium]|nr:hypothetical protein [Bryobacteraceae bacterium]
MYYKVFALLVLAVFSLGQPVMAATYWSTFNGASIGTIDTSSGVATIVGPSGQAGTYGVAEDPTTNILYASFGSSIGTVNKTTGAVTVIGNTTHAIYGITFDSSGQMWAVAVSGGALYMVNKATAVATLVGTAGVPGIAWMDIGFNGATLYGVAGDPLVTLYTINTTTGAATAVATVTGACTDVMGIGFGSDGTLYASDYTSAKFCTMNPATAVTTLIGAIGAAFPHGGDIGTPAAPAPPPPVPTLSGWAELVLAGLLLIGGCASLYRHKTRKAA